jgi:Secretion system C-terminal sorting domain
MRMKRKSMVLLAMMGYMGLSAQTPYPSAPSAPGNITAIEYFIRPFGGTDPGFGNGTLLAITPQQNISGYSESINLGALPQGFYRIALRSRDADGKWSLTNAGPTFSYIITPVYPVAPPGVTNIVRLEYVIDANLPFGSGTAIPIAPAADIANLNAVIDVSSITPGPHILYIRSQDANGQWSLTNIRFFSNAPVPNYPPAPPAPGNIQTLEYFIDTDPGFGLATPASITPGADITTSFSINGIAAGLHNFYIRSRNNPWGLTTVVPFVVGTVTPVNWLYVKGEMKAKASQIEWATASEQNSLRFELEHSLDGSNFTAVASITAAGNSNTQKNYSAVHPNPVRGVNFYRIKQVDTDGSYRYSAIISLMMQGSGGLQVSPNPAHNYFVLLLGGAAVPVQLNLYNSSGQRVMQQQLPAALRHTINTSNLPAGQYLLEIIAAGKKQISRVQLQ